MRLRLLNHDLSPSSHNHIHKNDIEDTQVFTVDTMEKEQICIRSRAQTLHEQDLDVWKSSISSIPSKTDVEVKRLARSRNGLGSGSFGNHDRLGSHGGQLEISPH